MAATEAQCAYCFESLSASFEKRKGLSLDEVDQLWDEYHQKGAAQPANDESEATTRSGSSRPAAVNRLMDSETSSVSSTAPSASSSTPSLNTTASSATSKSSLFSVARRLGRNSGSKAKQEEEYPLFVTYETKSRSGRKELRGCIGTFEPHKLDEGLRSYALTSAFEDIRFSPITQRELPPLECSITLLTDFESISDPLDWEIGKHGIRINFTHKGRRYGSTYLPSVAPEQGWTKEETMFSLMRKAGWNGRSDEWQKVSDLNVVRYQGSKSALSYQEFREWRDWVDEMKSKS